MGKSQEIVISYDNLDKYGFSCFHHPGEAEINRGHWTRRIDIVNNAKAEGDHFIFRIPEEFLIPLSEGKKISKHQNFEISNIHTSVSSIKLLAERAGWNQTINDLHAVTTPDSAGVFIASYNHKNHKIPLGSGVSLPVNKYMSWIGMILVHPELRRQGLARAIMQSCLTHARLNQMKSIIGLDATPLGKQVYDSLGFRDSFLIWRSNLSTMNPYKVESTYEAFPFEFEIAIHYLEQKNYTERNQIIEILHNLPGSKNFMATSGNRVLGFVMSRPGRLKPFAGPLVADSGEVALLLIKKVLKYWRGMGHKSIFMDIPEHHFKDSIFSIGQKQSAPGNPKIIVEPVRSFMRMYQLISREGQKVEMDEDAAGRAIDSYKTTMAFACKEKNEIVPMMYGIAGPEWS